MQAGATQSGLFDRLAPLRVQLCYLWRHRRMADLTAPRRFTELVQMRKLHEREPLAALRADKLAVKAHVATALGPEWVTPTLWQGDMLPERPDWPCPFVLKSRHGCNQIAFVRDAPDWSRLAARTRRWMGSSYGRWLDEWIYTRIPRGLLAEPFIGTAGVLPIDYKFYVFGGKVAAIQVHLERERAHRWFLLDRNWRPLSGDDRLALPRPRPLGAMIAGAETLGSEFDFARIDLYDVAGAPRFGEISFYPGSGLDPFDPVDADAWLGGLWLAARAARDGIARAA